MGLQIRVVGIPTEEDILKDYGLLCQSKEMAVADFIRRGLCGGLPLDAGPGQVHIKEEEKDAEAEDGGLLGK